MVGEDIRERIRSLAPRERLGLLALALLIVAGAAFWYARSLPGKVRLEALSAERAAAPGGRGGVAASPSSSPSAVVVYVAGWVRRPGVYELHQGDRVVDAVRLAGGAKAGADLTSLNLAALLSDGQQIVLYRKGRTGPALSTGTSTVGSTPPGGVAALVNLNTATLDELDTLPGIGPALGQRIIDYRQTHGPFRSVDDLLNVSGIGEKRLADLRTKVTV